MLMKYALIAATVFFAASAQAEDIANPLVESETWQDLQYDILGDVQPIDGAAFFSVEAPYRAEDAATVPLKIRQTDPSVTIDSAIVVIDENPAPVAAEMEFGPAMQPLDFSLRVRVNQYSNLRVIANTDEGRAMNGRFIKASGGCSAPATKDPEVALSTMGQMRVRQFEATGEQREAQIMIRHPNYSGLQRDQVTQLFIPAHFIDRLEMYQGDELLFTMTGGISISENPVFRFRYRDNGADQFHVRATDTDGNRFEESFPIEPPVQG